jgi:hypothetical protein
MEVYHARKLTSKMVIFKTNSKSLDINCRHSAALTGIDRHQKRVLMALFLRVHDNYVEEDDEGRQRIALRFMRRQNLHRICRGEVINRLT